MLDLYLMMAKFLDQKAITQANTSHKEQEYPPNEMLLSRALRLLLTKKQGHSSRLQGRNS